MKLKARKFEKSRYIRQNKDQILETVIAGYARRVLSHEMILDITQNKMKTMK